MDEVFGGNFRNDIKVLRGTKSVQSQFNEISSLATGDDSLFLYAKRSTARFKPLRISLDKQAIGKWDTFWRGTDRPKMRYRIFSQKPAHGQWRWKRQRGYEAKANYEKYLVKFSQVESLDDYYLRNLREGRNLNFVRLNEDGTVQYHVPPRDTRLASTVWTDIRTIGRETNYPTEKHEDLLCRIIEWLSNPGDLVMDFFAGSGTTAAVAEKLGRRWMVSDFGKHAIYTMQKRMLGIDESKAVGKDVKKNRKYDKPPKPFCVVSTGAYDFSRIMKLRENKDAYIDFVLGLFQSSRDEKDLSGKYRLTNIFGEKEGDPVEVYPVWNDEYLKNIRIDENYLKGIIVQSRGKLKGNYYIITPETCTLVGDTTMKNSAGNDVYFRMLKFPYKILEDVSRNFQIQPQPSSQENVNNLINSTGFYFNDDVEIEVEIIKQGLKITRFETKILDKQEKRLKGIDGLAMLLVDVDYDGEIFDMDRTVFAKDIGEDGKIRMTGLKERIVVIAIDKHGNESKVYKVEG